jgi:predicted RNase H-like nuclease (RuvC/YqgF family)
LFPTIFVQKKMSFKKKCDYFFSEKGCSEGNKCKFSHEGVDNSYSPQPCRFYMSSQGCNKGDGCRFFHPNHDEYDEDEEDDEYDEAGEDLSQYYSEYKQNEDFYNKEVSNYVVDLEDEEYIQKRKQKSDSIQKELEYLQKQMNDLENENGDFDNYIEQKEKENQRFNEEYYADEDYEEEYNTEEKVNVENNTEEVKEENNNIEEKVKVEKRPKKKYSVSKTHYIKTFDKSKKLCIVEIKDIFLLKLKKESSAKDVHFEIKSSQFFVRKGFKEFFEKMSTLFNLGLYSITDKSESSVIFKKTFKGII